VNIAPLALNTYRCSRPVTIAQQREPFSMAYLFIPILPALAGSNLAPIHSDIPACHQAVKNDFPRECVFLTGLKASVNESHTSDTNNLTASLNA
jgi:hypothetical protein